MASYAIGIGGSGARCIEALVHLCAMGLGPDTLHVLLVDADEANENLKQAERVISHYIECRSRLGFDNGSSIFKTEIVVPREGGVTWSPVTRGEADTLRAYFEYDILAARSRPHADLLRLLYRERELNLPLFEGFQGVPAIGAPLMARVRDSIGRPPWQHLVSSVKQDVNSRNEARIFVIGSVFGGTGAAGLPALGAILRTLGDSLDHPDLLRLGTAMLLPYFGFEPPKSDFDEIHAKPEDFLVNTHAALWHYQEVWSASCPYNAVFLIGDQVLEGKERRFARGGRDQRNPAHYVEFLTSLAAIHFLAPGDQPRGFFDSSRNAPRAIGWDDVPLKAAREKFLHFATFGASYLAFFEPLLKDEAFERLSSRMPWYVDHFLPADSLSGTTARDHQAVSQKYLRSFFTWLHELHNRYGDFSVDLMNRDVVAEFAGDGASAATARLAGPERYRFSHLSDEALLDLGARSLPRRLLAAGYDELWTELCRPHRVRRVTDATGRFLSLLYQASSDFCTRHYGSQE